MKEYAVNYKLNGVSDTYYVTVSEVNLPYSEIKPTIISELKKYLRLNVNDKLEIISINPNK